MYATVWLWLVLLQASPEGAEYYRPSWPVQDCKSLRSRILEQRGAAIFDVAGCQVIGGVFPEDYSRTAFIATGWRDVDVEHCVPSRRMWDLLQDLLGRPPPPDLWLEVFTDPDNLWISDAHTNRSKGDRGPDGFCPVDRVARKEAEKVWRLMQRRYGWRYSPEEERGLQAWKQGRCAPGSTR